jgi:hypothetical protein
VVFSELTGTSLAGRLRQAADAQCRVAVAVRAAGSHLDAGRAPTLIAGRIDENITARNSSRNLLRLARKPQRSLSDAQLDTIAETLEDLVRRLPNADLQAEADLYSRIGLCMTYRPGPQEWTAEVTCSELRAPVCTRTLNLQTTP